MANENAVRNLIRIDDKTNPTLFRALQLMVDDLYKINNEVFPPAGTKTEDQTAVVATLDAPENFTGTAYPDNLRLDWDALDGAFRYQIKMGHDWDTAKPVVITSADVANEDPVFLNLIYGTYNFILRAINLANQLGDPTEAVLIIPQIGPPGLAVEVIINTVLLRWTQPASAWRIDHYNIYKNGTMIGTINGTFKLLQEQVGGTYSYAVEAVDIVGNVSTRSAVQTVELHDPSEFEFVAELSAQYNGTYVRTDDVVISNIRGIIGPTQIYTWQQHYETFGFISPEDQVNKGYPIYYQPSYVGTGTYEEVFDFAQIYTNLTIVVDYNKLQLNGNTDIFTELSYSNDGVAWSAVTIGISTLAPSFRYVKVKWTWSNVDDKSSAFLSNLKVLLNVILTIDSGTTNALAADVDGTLVTYNKVFTGVNSVTATTAVSFQPLYAVVNSRTKDNFKVVVFDSSGNRVSASVSWKARGVV